MITAREFGDRITFATPQRGELGKKSPAVFYVRRRGPGQAPGTPLLRRHPAKVRRSAEETVRNSANSSLLQGTLFPDYKTIRRARGRPHKLKPKPQVKSNTMQLRLWEGESVQELIELNQLPVTGPPRPREEERVYRLELPWWTM